ncbi:multiple antibiotic resistance protein MarC [Neoasaia chiangmaiensis NBRC 101099]|uniref:UPF0056 membrane protein n=1 Tax=Neoasaia chiangmaiensis TaxID=320497 RepID=A0A1U9KN55_9PROT|nr:MarC family protein [Neoasaia chiangmaiensis]AQS87130.1 hypothetical protein A0U93_03360 [Neoasaia chiangmaiensis]GBR38133.1 multiple antibiotic resistance protein MarC [Neoasaia chiangmaiensis NBRC 101099]GEN16031.1 UPF0056 inner membrane protein [Neoasaia chiangmaiensis]
MVTSHVVTENIGLQYVSSIWLMAYSALFSIVNPLGASLIFAQATMGRARPEVVSLARLVAFYSFVVLMVSIWFGGEILTFFGITINALRVTGGLVVATRAWSMLQEPEESEARKERQALQGGRTVATPDLRDKAFFPFAMPFTVGPGSISVAIALSSERPAVDPRPAYFMGLTLAVICISVTVGIVYAYAERIVALLGVTGARIVSRLAALILLCIGIQILFSGIEGFVNDVAQQWRTYHT